MNFLKKIIFIWWLRIISYVILSLLFIIFFRKILPFELINFQIDITLGLLLPLFIFESFRFRIYRFYYGLKFDNRSLSNISKGFLIALFVMVTILIFCFILGIKISFNHQFELSQFIEFFILLFFISFSEELLFRGLIFQTLLQKFHPIYIILIFSLIFAFAHYSNHYFGYISFLNIFLAGVLFGLILLKKLDLWYCISLHFFWNLLQVMILDSPVSGFNYQFNLLHLEFNNTTEIVKYILGNNFGIESGFITTFLLLVTVINVSRFMKIDFHKHKIFYKRKLMEKYFLKRN